MLQIGCHLSSSKGFLNMGKEIVKLGGNTFQFFTRNPRGGAAKPIDEKDIEAFKTFAKENNIKNIVVATTTGGNLTYLEDEKDLHIVGVTNAYDQGQNQMREEVRKHFEEAGMDIVTAGHALSGAERCFSTYFGGYGPTEIVANTLRMFSQGVKVCVEVSTMALDAGKIPYQEKIVAIAGSGRGADTVVLLTPSYTKSILDTKVHKIIEMPE